MVVEDFKIWACGGGGCQDEGQRAAMRGGVRM